MLNLKQLKKYGTNGFIGALSLVFLTFAGCENNSTPTDASDQQSNAQFKRGGPPSGFVNAPAV